MESQSEYTPGPGNALESPPPTPEPFWGWLDFLLFTGLLIAMLLLLLLIAGAATAVWPSLRIDPSPILLPLQAAFYLAIYLAFLLCFRTRHNKPVWQTLGWRNTVSGKTLLWLASGGAALSPIVSGIAAALHTPEVKMDILEQLAHHPVILALFGIMAATLGPVFEELLFRGFLQPLFSKTLGVITGVALTSLLFGALHAYQYKFVWQYVAAVSLVGAVLGVVRYRTGSIIASSVMHACYNSVFVAEMALQHK